MDFKRSINMFSRLNDYKYNRVTASLKIIFLFSIFFSLLSFSISRNLNAFSLEYSNSQFKFDYPSTWKIVASVDDQLLTHVRFVPVNGPLGFGTGNVVSQSFDVLKGQFSSEVNDKINSLDFNKKFYNKPYQITKNTPDEFAVLSMSSELINQNNRYFAVTEEEYWPMSGDRVLDISFTAPSSIFTKYFDDFKDIIIEYNDPQSSIENYCISSWSAFDQCKQTMDYVEKMRSCTAKEQIWAWSKGPNSVYDSECNVWHH